MGQVHEVYMVVSYEVHRSVPLLQIQKSCREAMFATWGMRMLSPPPMATVQ